MLRRAALALCVFAQAVAGPSVANSETLGDIRQELTVLYVEIQQLKRELSTTGGATVSVGGDTLQRVDLIERELKRLTARTEDLQFRIERVVRDGTNRVGDLEFRLCELEADCDIATLEDTPTLGGTVVDNAPAVAVPEETAPLVGGELAVGERADFDAALAALQQGDVARAATLFETFVETYPGGPLSGEAHFYRGEALAQLGRDRDAGLAYLESFSGTPNGPVAAEALIGLGISLGKLGQINEACATLGEVSARFPGSTLIPDAEQERSRFGCS